MEYYLSNKQWCLKPVVPYNPLMICDCSFRNVAPALLMMRHHILLFPFASYYCAANWKQSKCVEEKNKHLNSWQ